MVSSHPHFDHSAGLAAYIAQGITVIADDNSKFFVEAAFSEPRTLVGDLLAKSGKKPKVEGVIDTLVLRDETRALELYHVDDLQHTDSMLVALEPRGEIYGGQVAAPAWKQIVTFALGYKKIRPE